MKHISSERFEELVADALDEVPAELMALLDNVVVLVEDRNPEDPELLGLYHDTLGRLSGRRFSA